MIPPSHLRLSAVLALPGYLLAAAETATGKPAAEVSAGTEPIWNLCEWMSSKPGTLYKNADNPFLQELVFGGRFQWQAAYVSGSDVNGYGFSDNYTEFRRVRLESSAAFLRFFKLKAGINVEDDTRSEPGGGTVDWGYRDFDVALLTFDVRKAFGLDAVDALSLTYGRHKFDFGHEAHASSKELLTVERSAIVNKVYGTYRPTGFSAQVAKGDWALTGTAFSTEEGVDGVNNEFLSAWNDGIAYYASLGYEATDEWSFLWDFVYNDADALRGEDSLWTYSWATSLAGELDAGRWGLILNGIYGDNGDAGNGVARRDRQGGFWGLVAMPHAWIIEKKLQGVVRYQYAGSSEAQGLRANSRYLRADHGPVVDVNDGRGNEHHALYAGLNHYFCGHHLKVQAGVEYDWMNSPGAGAEGDLAAFTWWFGFRNFF